MTLRKPDPEIVEDVVREEADDVNGLLNLPESRKRIQQKYRERFKEKHRRVSTFAPKAEHEEIRELLDEFAADDQRDIEHVTDEVYFTSPFNRLDLSGEEEVIDRLTDIYHLYLVFSGERIRQEFDIPVNNSEFFIRQLEDQNLVERLSHAQDVFTIGSKIEQITDEPGVEEQLRDRATEGIIKNDKFEEIIDAPATEEVVSLFVNRDYLVDMDGEYLVKEAQDDYIDHLVRETLSDVRSHFEDADYVMLVSEYRTTVNQTVREQSDLLSHAPELEDEVLSAVREGIADNLGLEADTTDEGHDLYVQTDEFEDEVATAVEDITDDVLEEDYRRAGDYFDAADERIEGLAIPGGAVVNHYYREIIRTRCHKRINEVEFGDTREIDGSRRQ